MPQLLNYRKKFMDQRSFLKTLALSGTAAAASSLAAPAYARASGC